MQLHPPPFSHVLPVSVLLLLLVSVIPLCEYGSLDGKLLISSCGIESKVARNITLWIVQQTSAIISFQNKRTDGILYL
jgi:hypothetical protein